MNQMSKIQNSEQYQAMPNSC